MEDFTPRFTRRDFLAKLAQGAVSVSSLGMFTEESLRFFEHGDYWQELVRTPSVTEGPFYPDKLPLDVDNDLLVIGKGSRAAGEVTHLTGRILDAKGNPMKNAVIEIWQVDDHGAYLHSGSGNAEYRDFNFQGFGRFETASDGRYRFRTIKPVPYPGRTPHIHVKVLRGGDELLTTQCCIKGHPMNARDGVLRGVRDQKQRESLIVPFDSLPGSRVGELAATFDIVLGWTPEA